MSMTYEKNGVKQDKTTPLQRDGTAERSVYIPTGRGGEKDGFCLSSDDCFFVFFCFLSWYSVTEAQKINQENIIRTILPVDFTEHQIHSSYTDD